MICKYINEPELRFGISEHIDIKFGIMNFGVFDFDQDNAPRKISIGIIGTNEDIEVLLEWLDLCKIGIPAKESNKKHLFPKFPGFNENQSFYSKIVNDSTLNRILTKNTVKEINSIKQLQNKVREAVDLFISEIEYLAENSHQIDVIICAIPKEFTVGMYYAENIEDDEEVEENLESIGQNKDVYDFRRLLKAQSLKYRIPIQIILPHTYNDKIKKRMKTRPNSEGAIQDKATRAWNFFTALYYKSGGIPWRIIRKSTELQSCFIGISFFRNLQQTSYHTSTAQIFNERGEGLIIRGGEAKRSPEDLQIHLSAEESESIVTKSLFKYKQEHYTLPARVVIHKTSDYNQDEIDGIIAALRNTGIELFDLLSFSKSTLRLHRDGKYPPLRGTFWDIDDENKILYTRGSVDFFETYPGLYIPKSLRIKVSYSEQSTIHLANEILSLTKMNWNNTQFDNSLPITIKAARQVGDILKYIENENYESAYCYYM